VVVLAFARISNSKHLKEMDHPQQAGLEAAQGNGMNTSNDQKAELFTIQIGSAQIAGEMSGKGQTLIFLHAGVADRRMWRPQMAELRQSYQTVAYDCRGFGATTTAVEPFSNVADLHHILERLKIQTTALVGCSQGGRTAIDFALTYPERVDALVLIAPAVSGAPRPDSYPPEAAALIDELDQADEAGDLARVNEIEANLWLDGPTSPPGRVGGDVRDLFLAMNGIALSVPQLELEIEPVPAYNRLVELALPVLVIWGDLDFPHLQERCRTLVARIPGAQGVEIHGAAHLPNLEQPEVINQLLKTFLN
jgi:pimeloyl-ACP methyl ester carboxylesterase